MTVKHKYLLQNAKVNGVNPSHSALVIDAMVQQKSVPYLDLVQAILSIVIFFSSL